MSARHSTRSRAPSLVTQGDDFSDLVYDQVKNAPWVGLSLLAHGALFGVLLIWPWDTGEEKPAVHVLETAYSEPIEKLDDPPPPPPPEPKTDPPEVVNRETEIEPRPLPPDPAGPDNEDDTAPGELENFGEIEIDGMANIATIGIGSGNSGPFGNRGTGKGGGGGDGGGSPPQQKAVDMALEWLKNHQSADGRWECDNFQANCKVNTCDHPGEAAYTPGVSGLALLTFLGRGETHQSGEYAQTVKRGLKYLKQIQDSEGCFGPRTSQHFMYNHACAALAMTEAYGMTGSRLFKDAAQRGVNFVHQSQNPYLAWRYGVRDGDNDTSVTGWMTMVLKSAKMSELEVDSTAFKGAVAWVDKMTEPEFGRVGYQQRGGPPARTTEMMEKFPADRSESLTSVGVLTRIFAGQDPDKNEKIQKGLDLMVKKAPKWDLDSGEIDMYYWYYGSLAMFQAGGEHWKRWQRAMEPAIVKSQRTEAKRDERGSWDPVGPWGPEGGRVYSTAVMAMSLQVYYRYGRVFGTR